MPPVINEHDCIRCGKCAEICSDDVYFGSKENEIPEVTYPDDCWHCNACVDECPAGAIKLRIPLPMMLVCKPDSGLQK